MFKLLEAHLNFEELLDCDFPDDYLESLEYTIQAYNDGKIVYSEGDYKLLDMSSLDMTLIDLVAVRWNNGDISTSELKERFKTFYMRA